MQRTTSNKGLKKARLPQSAPKAQKPKKALSSVERNKEVMRRFTEAHNQNNIEELKKFLDSTFISHISDMPKPLNRDQYLEAIQNAHQAFSHLVFTIEDMICEKDKVVIRFLACGKHTGNYQGIAPTQRLVAFGGIVIRRLVKGKIAEEWQTNDQLSLIMQLVS